MSDYRVLIFDWDGTLADSIDRIVVSIHQASRECGLPQRDDVRVKGIIGLSLPEAAVSLYPDMTDPLHVQRFRSAYSEHYLKLEATPSPLFAGVAESLESFRAQGYQLAVATGKGRAGLERVLKGNGWENFFDVTRCGDEGSSKPHPLMIEEILAHCAAKPSEALMVGDSSFDLLMARNAGVDSVAVGYGAQPLETLREFGPVLAVEQFCELHDWLGRG